MFTRIRKRVTYANVALTVALVFAMTGGAYAAGKYLITSTKQISPKVLKSLQGKAGKAGKAGGPGPAGPAGPQGPAGPKGENGTPGANGANGKDGVSVTSSVEAAGVNCPSGGSKFVSAGSTTYACNGQTGYTEFLPSQKSEKGQWSLVMPTENPTLSKPLAYSSISFVIPLESVPHAHFLQPKEQSTECPGSASSPQAAPGNLCIYEEENYNGPSETLITASTVGANISSNPFQTNAPGGIEFGAWAVTAE